MCSIWRIWFDRRPAALRSATAGSE